MMLCVVQMFLSSWAAQCDIVNGTCIRTYMLLLLHLDMSNLKVAEERMVSHTSTRRNGSSLLRRSPIIPRAFVIPLTICNTILRYFPEGTSIAGLTSGRCDGIE